MQELKFAIDSDPWQGGHENNLKVAKQIFPQVEIVGNFESFGITGFVIESEMSRDELRTHLRNFYDSDKIRGAQLR